MQRLWMALGHTCSCQQPVTAANGACHPCLHRRDKRKKAKERKGEAVGGKGTVKTEKKTQKNEVGAALFSMHGQRWLGTQRPVNGCISAARVDAHNRQCSCPVLVHMVRWCMAACVQEKKERRAVKALEGDEDDIDALLAK